MIKVFWPIQAQVSHHTQALIFNCNFLVWKRQLHLIIINILRWSKKLMIMHEINWKYNLTLTLDLRIWTLHENRMRIWVSLRLPFFILITTKFIFSYLRGLSFYSFKKLLNGNLFKMWMFIKSITFCSFLTI